MTLVLNVVPFLYEMSISMIKLICFVVVEDLKLSMMRHSLEDSCLKNACLWVSCLDKPSRDYNSSTRAT